MFTSFTENIRRPKNLTGWADTGEIHAGENDPAAQAFDSIRQERRRDYNDQAFASQSGGFGNMRRGGVQQIGNGLMGQMPLRDVNNKMDVVYNQGPEMLQKQLNMQKDKMAANQKNIETERAIDATKANDNYIDNRRKNAMDQKSLDINQQDANTRQGESEFRKERLDSEMAGRHAISTQQAINRWVQERENNQNQKLTTTLAREKVAAAADALRGKQNTPTSPNDTNQNTSNKLQELMIKNPELASSIIPNGTRGYTIDPGASADIRARIAQEIYGTNNVPTVAGVNSAALGGELNNPGLRGDAPINNAATANPYAANTSNQAASQGGGGQVMRKTQRNPRTGATRILTSRDGGNTWQPE